MPFLSAVYWFIALLIWFAIAFWPARVAARKGHSFLGFFLLSLLFFPLSLILAYVVADRNTPPAPTPPPATPPTTPVV
jgi:energy-coupling factor transporter transmembrane protein EcfT